MQTAPFRQTTAADEPRIMEIIRRAQARMRARGSDQWQHGYPAAHDIAGDTACGYGHVLCERDAIAAYGAVIFGGEPAYETIDGAWPDQQPYVTVHRLAVAEEHLGKGMGARFLQEAEMSARMRGVFRFRIDTNFDNLPMRRILERLEFIHCGEVRYRNGARLAYWKRI